MKLAVRRSLAAGAAVATAGVSTLFVGALPASAAPSEVCGPVGDLVGPGVCELVFTADGTFTPTAETTKLEVLLVGEGGDGQNTSGTTGYAAGGGGGEVRLVDFSAATGPIDVTVAADGAVGGVTDGIETETVDNGTNGFANNGVATGGSSTTNVGSSVPPVVDPATPSYGAGGGAGGAASGANGGPGLVVDAIAAAGSLFDGDPRCFGGGGAVGITGVTGLATCGGGAPAASGLTLIGPLANTGGGGGALNAESDAGASGVVIFRWNAAAVTLTFDANGHGTAPAPQPVVAGTAPEKPADPTAAGYSFEGWYLDEALTTPADFSAPLTESTTFYAAWVPALAATGVGPDGAVLPIGIATLLAGAGLVVMATRRRREAD